TSRCVPVTSSFFILFYYDTALYSLLPSLFSYCTATPEIYTLSLHDALPISQDFLYLGRAMGILSGLATLLDPQINPWYKLEQYRSEEHTSELQSRENLVCRLLLEKKKNQERKVALCVTEADNITQAIAEQYV